MERDDFTKTVSHALCFYLVLYICKGILCWGYTGELQVGHRAYCLEIAIFLEFQTKKYCQWQNLVKYGFALKKEKMKVDWNEKTDLRWREEFVSGKMASLQ